MDRSIFRKLELLDTGSQKRRFKNHRSSKTDANINITPLVDVVLVLLIIFMVVTPMINEGLKLPFSISAERSGGRLDDLKIFMLASGQIKIGDATVTESNLNEILSKELSKNPARAVYVSADKSLQYVKVRKLLASLRDNGISQAGLMSTINPEES